MIVRFVNKRVRQVDCCPAPFVATMANRYTDMMAEEGK
jgi:hypothetical protein